MFPLNVSRMYVPLLKSTRVHANQVPASPVEQQGSRFRAARQIEKCVFVMLLSNNMCNFLVEILSWFAHCLRGEAVELESRRLNLHASFLFLSSRRVSYIDFFLLLLFESVVACRMPILVPLDVCPLVDTVFP